MPSSIISNVKGVFLARKNGIDRLLYLKFLLQFLTMLLKSHEVAQLKFQKKSIFGKKNSSNLHLTDYMLNDYQDSNLQTQTTICLT